MGGKEAAICRWCEWDTHIDEDFVHTQIGTLSFTRSTFMASMIKEKKPSRVKIPIQFRKLYID